MVIRFWQGEGPEPEAFSHLVEETRGGIRTTRLTGELRDRGYRVRSAGGDLPFLRSQVEEGRPVVALIEVAPGRFHYVVVVSVLPDGVLLHDPARAPFRFLSTQEFRRRWSAASSWAMLLLPGEPPGTADSARADGPTDRRDVPAGRTSPMGSADDLCARMIRQAVRWADSDRLREAAGVLRAATARCPESPSAWRELAGVRFRQREWEGAARAADRALEADPGDVHTLRILAASRYLQDDLPGALRAWNRLGEPTVGVPRVYGLRRVPYRSLVEHLGLPSAGALTPERLRRTRRRAEAFPGLESSRVWYRPPPGERESGLRVAISERPGFPPSLPRIGRWTLRSVASRRIEVESAGPGALAWTAATRAWSPRPEAELEASTPGLFGAPGVWTARGDWKRRTYGFPEGVTREERFTARLGWARWVRADLRTGLGMGLYRWPGRGRSIAAGASLEWRSQGDRLAVLGQGAGWTDPAQGPAFARLGVAVSGRSSTGRDGLVGNLRGGFERATPGAPPSEWPGAGHGEARPILLRAHPLLEEGTVRGEAFGRRLAWAGASADLWTAGPGPVLLGFGAFVDAAKAWDRPGGIPPSPLHVDAGFGLRMALDEDGGALYLDVARGLEDGASAFDVGWHASWPGSRSCCGFP